MKAGEIVDLFRIEMHDTATPPMFADEQLFIYLNDAQNEFARETGGIPDASTFLLDAKVGDTSFKYDPRILKIRGAYRVSDGHEVLPFDYEEMRKRGLRFEGAEGPVYAFVIGMDDTSARWLKTVSVADTVQLIVDRMPLKDITIDSPEESPEIDPRHHMHLVKHMMALAYGNQDAEVFNKSKAIEKHAEFKAYCEKCEKEKERRKHKTRVVQYGGLPMQSRRRSYDYYRR
jgi:hypothetical protein